MVWQVRRENTFKAQPMSKSKESQKCKVCSGRGDRERTHLGAERAGGSEPRPGGPGCPAKTLDFRGGGLGQ